MTNLQCMERPMFFNGKKREKKSTSVVHTSYPIRNEIVLKTKRLFTDNHITLLYYRWVGV